MQQVKVHTMRAVSCIAGCGKHFLTDKKDVECCESPACRARLREWETGRPNHVSLRLTEKAVAYLDATRDRAWRNPFGGF